MIILERVNTDLLDEIVKRVNGYIRKIPKYPEKMLLPEDYYFGQCERLFHIKGKGYYSIYRLFDHGEVNVYFVGKSVQNIVANIFEERIKLFYSSAYENRMPDLELRLEFQNYCHKYAFPQNDCAMSMVSSSMKEIYIPYFIEEFLPKNERIINEFYSGQYSGHMMCFDQELGYLYVIPSTKGNLCVYSIGKETEKAFSNLIKVAAMDTLHLPWKW